MNLYGHGVVIGGGNIYENGGLDVDLDALRELRPPLMLCGLSYGRIYDERGQLRRRTDAMPDAVVRALGERAGDLGRAGRGDARPPARPRPGGVELGRAARRFRCAPSSCRRRSGRRGRGARLDPQPAA